MAEKQLKSIKFAGLGDTYVLPEIDDSLSTSGMAADAKATGDALALKAPSGYGLGGEAEQKDWSEVDSITANGTYRFGGIHQTINGIYVTSATMLVINFGGSYCTQILRTVENASGHYKSYTLVRSKGAIGWDAWECPDPPMQVGVEYRTTERWNGNVVYTKLIDFGAMPNNTIKRVSGVLPWGASIIGAEAYSYRTNSDGSFLCSPVGSSDFNDGFWFDSGATTACIYTTEDMSNFTAKIIFKYTKI